MGEELVLEKPAVEVDSFDGFSEPPEERIAQPAPEEKEIKPEEKSSVAAPVKTDESAIVAPDVKAILKENLGYEDWDSAKKEIELLRNKPAPELKYESLDAAKIKELYSVIDKKERLGALINGDITKELAVDIIKTAMIEKYKGLSNDMINRKFDKLYSIPPAPKEDDFADTDEFDIAKNQWKEKVADIEMEMMIEANVSKPELEKLYAEIKLPDINIPDAEKKYTAEELAAFQKASDEFVQKAEETLNSFEGFNVSYKDKDVDIQTNYSLSADEKSGVLNKFKLLAEQNYNANAVFAERWVNTDSTFNFQQIAKDLATLETQDKMAQKFVSDAATKATLKFIKEKHNPDLNDMNRGGDLQLEDKEAQKKNEDAIWA